MGQNFTVSGRKTGGRYPKTASQYNTATQNHFTFLSVKKASKFTQDIAKNKKSGKKTYPKNPSRSDFIKTLFRDFNYTWATEVTCKKYRVFYHDEFEIVCF